MPSGTIVGIVPEVAVQTIQLKKIDTGYFGWMTVEAAHARKIGRALVHM